jgi:O-antigen/teichoic acid export membrane protein
VKTGDAGDAGDVAPAERKLLGRAVLINFAALAGKGFWPLFLYLVARWYGAATLGQFTLLQAPLELLLALGSTGFVDGIHRNLARLPGEPVSASGYASIRLALGGALAIGGALALLAWLAGGALVAGLWDRPELHAPMMVMALGLPLGGATSVLVATATAMMRNEGEALIKSALVPGLTLALAASAPFVAAGIEGLAWAYALAQAAGLLAALLLFSRVASLRQLLRRAPRGAPPLIDAAAQLRFGLLQGLNMMLWMGVYSLDTLLLGAFAGDAEVARYRAGSELARLLQYARTQVSSAFTPMAGRYLLRNDRAALQALITSLARALAGGALLLAGALAYLAEPLLAVLLGSSGAPDRGAGFVALLLAGHVVIAAFALAGNTLVLAGRQRLILLSSAAMAAVNLLLGVLLVPRWGAEGAALATLAAMTAAMLGQVVALRASLGLTLPWRALGARAVAAAACALLAHLTAASLPLATAWSRAAAGALSYTALYAALLMALSRRAHPPGRRPA